MTYPVLSHAIENTANQKARNPLLILRYATGSITQKKSRRSSRPKLFSNFCCKAFIHLMSSTYSYFLIIFNQNYVLSRNIANLLSIFSLIVFAGKGLKSDVLCFNIELKFNEWHGIN